MQISYRFFIWPSYEPLFYNPSVCQDFSASRFLEGLNAYSADCTILFFLDNSGPEFNDIRD
jgi:hypothetical protein